MRLRARQRTMRHARQVRIKVIHLTVAVAPSVRFAI
jgi:hypothetical protein